MSSVLVSIKRAGLRLLACFQVVATPISLPITVDSQQDHQNVLMSDQHRLSEQLQLLYHFGYSDIDMRYQDVGHFSNRRRRKWNYTKSTIRILDTIAVALTTGLAGDAYATAFDTSGGLTLVLAKNEPVTHDDDRAVRDLFMVVTAPQTSEPRDVYPFLFTRCGANIAKRIAKIDDAVRDISPAIEEVLKHYTPEHSIDKEFPHSALYLDLQGRVKDINLENLSATPDLCIKYTHLVLVALVLKRSLLLHSLCEPTGAMDRNRKLQAEQLKRRLAKVCQYYDGIADLITYTRRYFPQGIAHRWVDPIRDTGETTVNLEGNYLGAIERALGGVSPSTDTLTTLRRKFPNMGGSWSASRSITTRLHAEIRILLHLSKPFDALDHSQQQPIGYGRSDVDIAVMNGIQQRLTRTIAQLFPNQRRLSDEHRSSGSESEGSDSGEEMTKEQELNSGVSCQNWKRYF
ncbi:hypothetical protein F5J12DRAFT_784558 [Pisolithus orientalis]|uniref:uncharacterized protein n=1 Tax=Pisolithus orientalis TaxID=936130 RepID=UPI0022252DA6|nr:uncharacterized protein F5J12DRAFT_784558 [Pisolithus orientalis]KAI5999780.1 hypothetical protein F5J12DRAFT_784558 [Pisolithus orientalis]